MGAVAADRRHLGSACKASNDREGSCYGELRMFEGRGSGGVSLS